MTFCTTFKAIDTSDGILKTWRGQDIEASSWEEAEAYVNNHLGHLSIDGHLLREEDFKRTYPVN